MFNQIFITREDNSGTNLQLIKVPITYGPKNPQLVRTDSDPSITREAATVLPRMSFMYEGFEYDGDRKIASPQMFTKKDDVDLNKIKRSFAPVPYNIIFTLNIYTNNIEDGHKIVEQIIPFFSPDYTVSIALIPELDITMDVPVVLEDVESEEIYEGDFTTTRRGTIWTLTFKMKTYFFGPVVSKPIIKVGNTQFFIGNTATTNTIVSRTSVRPGLLANGSPTTNADATIPYANIAIDDNFGYVVINDEFNDLTNHHVIYTEANDTIEASGNVA